MRYWRTGRIRLGGLHMERRLAAILAADVVGYSRLMGDDEEGTIAALRQFRETLFEPAVQDEGGQILTAGEAPVNAQRAL